MASAALAMCWMVTWRENCTPRVRPVLCWTVWQTFSLSLAAQYDCYPLYRFLHMDLGCGNCRHQDCQSSFGTDCVQTLLLPPHKSKQTDWSFALHLYSHNVLVSSPVHICCRCRFICRRSGRQIYQDTYGLKNGVRTILFREEDIEKNIQHVVSV